MRSDWVQFSLLSNSLLNWLDFSIFNFILWNRTKRIYNLGFSDWWILILVTDVVFAHLLKYGILLSLVLSWHIQICSVLSLWWQNNIFSNGWLNNWRSVFLSRTRSNIKWLIETHSEHRVLLNTFWYVRHKGLVMRAGVFVSAKV